METSQLLWEFKRGEKRQWEVYSHSQFDLFVYRLDLFIKESEISYLISDLTNNFYPKEDEVMLN